MTINHYKQPQKMPRISLGARCREFESPHSDQLMIIRTTLSKWVMCSDLSFLLKMCFNRQGRVDKLALAFLGPVKIYAQNCLQTPAE